ncbi:MAG: hypothetical protein PHT89_04655 [Lachnospiraceae bacterium]|nr:hypothetical protein [Lachnospiraceae bacterium]
MGKIKIVCVLMLSFLLAFDNQASFSGRLISFIVLSSYLFILLAITKWIAGRFISDKILFNQLFDKAYLLLIPFTMFALVGRFYLGWDTVQAFISTGIMGSGGMLSAEGVKYAKRKKTLMIIITTVSFLTFFGFMQLAELLKGVQLG